MPFTMQGSRTQCILHRKPQHCVITLSHDALLIFPLTIPRDTVLRSLVMYNFSILKLQRQEYCRCRQWWVWLLQWKGTAWYNTMREKNNSGFKCSRTFPSHVCTANIIWSRHAHHWSQYSQYSHSGTKTYRKKKTPQRNHLTTSPWTMCSYMETVVI